MANNRTVIIRSKRFWYLYSDGRMEQISLSERAKAHLLQTKATEARMAKEEGPKRRTNNPPRSPGTGPMLPPAGRDIGDKTLTELAHDLGWGSVQRCTEALRENRPGVYERARANGKARGFANLNREQAAEVSKFTSAVLPPNGGGKPKSTSAYFRLLPPSVENKG